MHCCPTSTGTSLLVYLVHYDLTLRFRDMDFEERPIHVGGHHIARAADITLVTADDFQFDLDDPGYGFDLGPSDGIGSQDYDPLGIDFGEGPVSVHDNESQMEEDSMSVEFGRDAAPARRPRESLASHLLGRPGGDADLDILSVRSREASMQPFRDDMDFGFGPDMGDIDIGISFEPMDDQAPTPRTPRLTPSRACKFSLVILPPEFLR